MSLKKKIKKGDSVIVISGKYKGKIGNVLEVSYRDDKVRVSGISIVSVKNKSKSSSGSHVINKEQFIHISNVAYYDEDKKNFSKICFKFRDGKKMRFLKKNECFIEEKNRRYD